MHHRSNRLWLRSLLALTALAALQACAGTIGQDGLDAQNNNDSGGFLTDSGNGGEADVAAIDDANGPNDSGSSTSEDTAPSVVDAQSVDAGSVGVDAGTTPISGCCKTDKHCDKEQVCFFGPFNAGKCMWTNNLSKSECWTDDQCLEGWTCEGAMACGCNAACKAMDKPGVCVKSPGGNIGKKCSLGLGAMTIDCGKEGYCKLPDDSKCVGFGVCALKPQICPKLWKPACGCDGTTYPNSCSAGNAGTNIKMQGECVKPPNKCATVKCGNTNPCTSTTCNPATGKCESKPLIGAKCDDGDLCTMGDLCAVTANGVAYCAPGKPKLCKPNGICLEGSCDPKTGLCSANPIPNCNLGKKCSLGLGAMTIDCGKEGYCKLPDGSKCVGFGVCAPKPMACIKMLAPVCGCDNQTYTNDCYAGSHGTNVKTKGSCGGSSSGCCKAQADCNKDQTCFFGPFNAGKCMSNTFLAKNQCWTADQCAPDLVCEGAMACGCNAACKAVDKPGVCTKPMPAPCKVGHNELCPKDEYCNGACDQTGTCTKKPQACITLYKPVCGCDNKTYSNSCVAASSGVAMKSPNACGGGTTLGCCSSDMDCQKGAVCVNGQFSKGQCKDLSELNNKSSCWTNAQCSWSKTKKCVGTKVCPCKALCILKDEPGMCQ